MKVGNQLENSTERQLQVRRLDVQPRSSIRVGAGHPPAPVCHCVYYTFSLDSEHIKRSLENMSVLAAAGKERPC